MDRLSDFGWYSYVLVMCLFVAVVAIGLPMGIWFQATEKRNWQRAAISRGYATWEETADGDTEFIWIEEEEAGGGTPKE